MFVKAFGDSSVSYATVFWCHSWFAAGDEWIEDAGRVEQKAGNNEIIARVAVVSKDNRRASCRMIVESTGYQKLFVHCIPPDDLKKWEPCARFVPHVLTAEQWYQCVVHIKNLTNPVLSWFESTRLFCVSKVENGVEGELICDHKQHSNICNGRNWRLFLVLIFCKQCISWKIAPTSVLQLMAITLNKKIGLEFFGIFFGGFRSTVSKLMGSTVYE